MYEDELIQALYAIDAADLDYQEWVNVGMALHAAGYDCRDWDDWSSKDYDRYNPGECEEKWETFTDDLGEDGVSEKYIYRLAYDSGWDGPEREEVESRAFGWDDEIDLDGGTVEHKSTVTLEDAPVLSQHDQIEQQMSAMFEPDELVNVVIRTWENDGDKAWDMGFFLHPGEVATAIKNVDIDPDCGACLCVNPTDGKRRKVENLTALRLGLFESDEDDPEEFRKVTRALDLPVVCEVWSGNRSVHTVVRLDAKDRREYKKRWRIVAEAYEAAGITMDKACSAPNKLVRLAGVARGYDVQRLLSGPFGPPTFDAWLRRNEKPLLPPIGDLDIDEEIEPDPELIEGVLRYREVALLTSRAKRGKTWLTGQLAVCIATGRPWLGHAVKQGRVLFIDPELKPKTLRKRLQLITRAMNADEATVNHNIKRWSLRGALTREGNVADITAIAHDLELLGEQFDLVVLDSSSAFLEAGTEENDNAAIRRFLTGHVARIAKATGGAVLVVHHEGKGATGDRAAEDRARGAGAWVDCPDVVMQMSSIYPPDGKDPGEALVSLGMPEGSKARRLECVAIRDNPEFKPIDLCFDWPLFHSVTSLKDWEVQTSASLGGKAAGKIQQQKAMDRAQQCLLALNKDHTWNGWLEMSAGDAAAICSKELGEQVTPQTLKKYVESSDNRLFTINQTSPRRWHIVAKVKKQP